MLKVAPHERPMASQIAKTIEKYGKMKPGSSNSDRKTKDTEIYQNSLLKTIEIPANFDRLEEILPKRNYSYELVERDRKKKSDTYLESSEGTLPEIKSR